MKDFFLDVWHLFVFCVGNIICAFGVALYMVGEYIAEFGDSLIDGDF